MNMVTGRVTMFKEEAWCHAALTRGAAATDRYVPGRYTEATFKILSGWNERKKYSA